MAETKPSLHTITDELLHSIISTTAHTMSIVRKSNRALGDHTFWDKISSTREEMETDWSNACVFWSLKLLNGSICITDIEPTSNWRFKQVWLSKIKEAIAYFLWHERTKCQAPGDPEADYYEACELIRDKLVGDTKLSPKAFGAIKNHLVKKYLTTDGRIDETKNDTKELIGTKACRIWQSSRQNSDTRNWALAKVYTKMFYENIIPAIVDDNPENVLAVLKAFQFSEAPENGYHIVNCFELLLAVYFLDPSTIAKIWDESAEQLSSGSAIAVEYVTSWPSQFKIPADCHGMFELHQGATINDPVKLYFVGAMTHSQRDSLINRLEEEHRGSIEDLCAKSRVLTRYETL